MQVTKRSAPKSRLTLNSNHMIYNPFLFKQIFSVPEVPITLIGMTSNNSNNILNKIFLLSDYNNIFTKTKMLTYYMHLYMLKHML